MDEKKGRIIEMSTNKLLLKQTSTMKRIFVVLLAITMITSGTSVPYASVVFANEGDSFTFEYSISYGESDSGTNDAESNDTGDAGGSCGGSGYGGDGYGSGYGDGDGNNDGYGSGYGDSSGNNDGYGSGYYNNGYNNNDDDNNGYGNNDGYYDYYDYDKDDENIIPIMPFGSASVVINTITSPNQTFTTNDSNQLPLTLQIQYHIIGAGTAAGSELRIALEDSDAITVPNFPSTFFATDMSGINVELSSVGASIINVAGITVETVGTSNTLVIPFIGGADNVTLDTITIRFDYNRAWDGQLAPGNALHTFGVYAVNNGIATPQLAININSWTQDNRWFQGMNHYPHTIRIDYAMFFGENTSIFANPATSRHWEKEEGSYIKLTVDIPAGAFFDNPITLMAGESVYINSQGQLVLEVSTQTLGTRILSLAPRIVFPSTYFSNDDVVHVVFTVTYYLRCVINGPQLRIQTNQRYVTLTEALGVPGGAINMGFNTAQMMTMLANQQQTRNNHDDYIYVDNSSDLPLENVVITVYNNQGNSGIETGSRYFFRANWMINNFGNPVTSEWTFFIGNTSGGTRVATIIRPASPVDSLLGGLVFNLRAHASLAANEYIDRIEIRPQHNGQNVLSPGTQFRIRPVTTGFTTTGQDHTGGFVGQNSNSFDDIYLRFTITYDGPESLDETVLRRFVDPSKEGVDAQVIAMTSLAIGAIAPGEDLPVRFSARSNVIGLIGAFGNGSNFLWEQPSFLVFVPPNASIDTNQTVEAFRNLMGGGIYSLGNMTIEFLGVEQPGLERVYRLQTLSGVALGASGGVQGHEVIRFDLNITTPFGMPAGPANISIWAAPYAGLGARHTIYHLGNVSTTGLPTITGDSFYADTANWTDQNDIAPYLRLRTQLLNYTVASAAGMLARAQLYNNEANQWQIGGTSTVPVGGVGRFNIEIINSGNLYVGDIRLYNILPHTAVTNTAVGEGSVASQWNATLDGLSFVIYDINGVDITSDFGNSQIWMSTGSESNPATNYPIVRTAIPGSNFQLADANNIETARSFLFDLGTYRLPPGARIVIYGYVRLPGTMTSSDVGQLAQNSFVTSGRFFNQATGTAGQVNTPIIAETQNFVSSAPDNAWITGPVEGLVVRGLGDNVIGAPLEGVLVRLYNSGTAVANFTGQTFTTDANGNIDIQGLAAGTYYLRFMNPIDVTTGKTAVFAGPANLTQDGRNAIVGPITLNATAQGDGVTLGQVQLVRTGRVQVEFRRATDNSLVGSTINHATYVNLNTAATGTITPGTTAGITVPTGYSISGSVSQDFALTWDNPSSLLVFEITRDQFTVNYNNNGGTGTIASQTANTNNNITLSDGTGFSRTGHTLLGWATTNNATVATYALGATFTRGTQGTVTLYAVWQIIPYELCVVDYLILDVNDKYPTFVDNSLTWDEFVQLLEARTLLNNDVVLAAVSGVKTLTSPDFALVDFDTITNPPFTVTINASWPGGRTDSQTVLVHIVDRVRPVITIEYSTVTFRTNAPPSDLDEILYAAGVSVLDNYDGVLNPTAEFIGGKVFSDINWNLGNMEYAITINAVDSSGNEAYQEIIVVRTVAPPRRPGGGGSGEPNIEEPPVPLAQFTSDHIWYVRGYADGSFRPGNSITRAEMSMILFRLLDSANKYTPMSNNFSDVTTGWYAQAVSYLASRSIVTGYPDGTFRPNAPITRAELTAVMSRFFDLSDGTLHSFTDVNDNHWAVRYIINAVNRGWVIGFEDDTFRPDNSTTRAEAVTMLNRILIRRPNPATIRATLYPHLDYYFNMDALFTDITNSHWAYYDIMEAAVEHLYTLDENGLEIWSEVYIPWLQGSSNH